VGEEEHSHVVSLRCLAQVTGGPTVSHATWSVGGLLLQVERRALRGGPQHDGHVGRVAGGLGLRCHCGVTAPHPSMTLVFTVRGLGGLLSDYTSGSAFMLPMQSLVVTALFWWPRLALATAEVTAATTAAAEIAASDHATEDDQGLAPARSDQEVGVDILLAKLLGNVEAERAVVVINVPLGQVTEDGMGSIHVFELFRSFRVIRIFIWMVF